MKFFRMNVNEPVVAMLSLLAVTSEARKVNILMGCLTNAYMTEESAEQLAAIFSFINKGKAANAVVCLFP